MHDTLLYSGDKAVCSVFRLPLCLCKFQAESLSITSQVAQITYSGNIDCKYKNSNATSLKTMTQEQRWAYDNSQNVQNFQNFKVRPHLGRAWK